MDHSDYNGLGCKISSVIHFLKQFEERNEEMKALYQRQNQVGNENNNKLMHNLWNSYLYKQLEMIETNLKKYIENYDEIHEIEVNKSHMTTLLMLSVLGKNNINL